MVLEFLADGFEEIEALTPVDMLRRAGCSVITVSINKDKAVTGAHGIKVEADITADEAEKLANDNNLDMIILPGGMPGAKNLDESKLVDSFIKKALREGKYITAICASPMILGKRGILHGKKAVCYPGFEKYLEGAEVTNNRVERDGKIITGCGMGAALEFSLSLCEVMVGKEEADALRDGVLAK